MSRTTNQAVAEQIVREELTPQVDLGFGSEFRELARQRRFVRTSEPTTAPVDPAPVTDWRTAFPAKDDGAAAPTAPAPAAMPVTPPAPLPPVAAELPVPAPTPRTQRISEDSTAMLMQLATMSERLVDARERLALETARANHAEQQLDAANSRMMAARALVHEAQRATHAASERAAWLEGRNEQLQQALELAVNASFLTRWKWRREQRAQQS